MSGHVVAVKARTICDRHLLLTAEWHTLCTRGRAVLLEHCELKHVRLESALDLDFAELVDYIFFFLFFFLN